MFKGIVSVMCLVAVLAGIVLCAPRYQYYVVGTSTHPTENVNLVVNNKPLIKTIILTNPNTCPVTIDLLDNVTGTTFEKVGCITAPGQESKPFTLDLRADADFMVIFSTTGVAGNVSNARPSSGSEDFTVLYIYER